MLKTFYKDFSNFLTKKFRNDSQKMFAKYFV